MKKKFSTLLVFTLAMAMMVMPLSACAPKVDPVSKNETVPLVLQASEFDGVFNPFFYSSAYDGDVVGLVNVSLTTVDPSGAVVAGDDYATVAKSYTINTDTTDGSAEYEFVLKKGLKFSDGSAITADDVLFNLYANLDPKYDGSATMYTLPIRGLAEYRTQVTPDLAAKYSTLADNIFAIGEIEDYAVTAADISNGVTQALYDAYWTYVDKAGLGFTQEIVNYVLSNYGTDSYVKNNFHPGLTYNDLKNSSGLTMAYAMKMWGFGSFPQTFVEDEAGSFVKLLDAYEIYDENNPEHEGLPFYNVQYTLDANGAFVKIAEEYIAYDAENPAHLDLDRYKKTYVATTYDEWGNPLTGEYVKTQSAGYVAYDAAEHSGMIRYAQFLTFKSAVTKTEWSMVGEDVPTLEDYWTEIRSAYGTDYSQATGINYESAGTFIEDFIKELFIAGEGSKEVEGGVPSITGITKGTKTIGGITFETVKIITTKQDPKTILSLGVTVAPKSYYTQGYTYTQGAIVNYGVEFDSIAFMNHLKSKNNAPVGAGPYEFKEFKDNIVYFERNTNFKSFGFGNAKIKFVRMKVISGGQEYDAVKSGEVHYATVSATSDVVSEVSTISNLTSVLVDNLGYGYICVNPKFYPNLNERIAIQTLFNLDLVFDYYPNGLAEIITRSMSKVSWAYPDDAEALYNYDLTGAAALQYFLAAGYTQDTSGSTPILKKADGSQAEFKFSIPSGAADHPAGQIFIQAKRILDALGAKASIIVDANLIANIKKPAGVGIYALAWQASLDPDMYQVYHYLSQAESVNSNGIKDLYENGTPQQKQMLEDLAAKIEEARDYMNPAERAPIYAEALEILAELVIEIPTYQRKNMFVYSNSVIKASTLSQNITPYWGPMAEIWKVEIAE